MEAGVSRRRILLGAAGVAGVATLTGCSGNGGPLGGADTPTFTPVPLPDADVDPTSIAAVGSRVPVGPLAMVVMGVEVTGRTVVLGGEIDPGPDNQFLVVRAAFRNATDHYVALVVDRFDVAASGGFFDSVQPFDTFASPSFGGWPFAPGERRTVTLHYAVPEHSLGVELRGALRVRSLPEVTFANVPPVVVDLEATASDPTRLHGAVTAPVHDAGDRVTATDLTVHLRRVVPGVDLDAWDPTEGHEFLAFNFAVTNAEGATPAAVGVGRFGGMAVADDRGVEYTRTLWFPGTVAGGTYYDDGPAVVAGETRVGTTIVEVPTATAPLYLFWTPPANRWRAGTGVAVNRYVWRVR
jgi:hypothetical protein